MDLAKNRPFGTGKRRRSAIGLILAYLFSVLAVGVCFSQTPASAVAVPPIKSGPALAPDTNPFAGERFTASVVKTVDGDSLTVERGGKRIEIRLAEIDTPEYDQPYGQDASVFTHLQASGRTVFVEVQAIDAYRRRVSKITLPDGRILNRELVKAGLAWWYRYYSQDESLGRLETEARESKRGLWADPNPVPPWTHRRNRRREGLAPIDPLEL
jgi:endonuclease YncB( thermonuclease family)